MEDQPRAANGRFIDVGDHIKALLEEKDKTAAVREEVYDAERKSDALALALQAREYERRLEGLNNSFERSRADRLDFVTKTQYANDLSTNTAKVEALAGKVDDALVAAALAVDVRFKPLEKIAGRATLLFAGSAVFGAVITYIVTKALEGGGTP